ncbi:MAG: putative bifunctional diguanylate cyclase/phosphodiesterase [Bacillota bacterium]
MAMKSLKEEVSSNFNSFYKYIVALLLLIALVFIPLSYNYIYLQPLNNLVKNLDLYIGFIEQSEVEVSDSNLAEMIEIVTVGELDTITVYNGNEEIAQAEEISGGNDAADMFRQAEQENEVQYEWSSLLNQSFYYIWTTPDGEQQYLHFRITYTYLAVLGAGLTILLIVFVLGLLVLKRKLSKNIEASVIEPINVMSWKMLSYKVKDDESKKLPATSIQEINNIKESYMNMVQEIETTYNKLVTNNKEITSLNKQLKDLAEHDSLTGLPNRRKFIGKLEEELSRESQGAVVLLDLDNFKEINDTLGHLVGDQILKKVAHSIADIPSGKMYPARYGGDEFLIMIRFIEGQQDIEDCIKKIKEVFQENFTYKQKDISLGCSIGIARFPEHSQDKNQLITYADTAMYRAKKDNKGEHLYFDEQMIAELETKREIKNKLQDALVNDGFKLLYQPQVDLKTSDIASFEALIRLKDHDIFPQKFIPLSEETGLIVEIGRWVTRAAIEQLAAWREAGYLAKPISINYSVEQLQDSGYAEFLAKTIEEFKLQPELVEIEITESVLFKNTELSLRFINSLKNIGVKIALDDFGSGYCSLNYLSFIPADKVKVDKLLIEELLSKNDLKVLGNLISLFQSMDLVVVAEGIERLDQYKNLRNMGCDYVQGYIFSHPLGINEVGKIYNKKLNPNRFFN